MPTPRQPGKIFTFYSYKGGTGRSMALANVAWILASAGKRVLVIDWDLEAPGLHRYFRPFLIDHRLTSSPGLIDFVIRYATEAVKPSAKVTSEWIAAQANILDYRISLDWEFPHGGALHLVPAGKQDVTYAARVSTFNWQKFYEGLGGGVLMNAVRDHIRREYDFVLIDSRTGVSDTAGICTVQLPDELVVCFTYNNQSTEGAAGVARSVFQQKFVEGGESSFRVHPVPMRVDPYEEVRLKRRQQHARKLFEPLLIGAPTDRVAYWTNVELPNIAAFAYEEVLATFSDEPSDPKRLLAALIRVTAAITQGEVASFQLLVEPEERAEVLARFADVEGEDAVVVQTASEDPVDAAVRRAERVYAALPTEDQVAAKWLWLRMVRVTTDEEASDLARIRVAASELDPERIPRRVIDRFQEVGVVVRSLSHNDARHRDEKIEPLNDAFINRWGRIAEWVAARRDFLLWRQTIRMQQAEWTGNPFRTLGGAALKYGNRWLSPEYDLTRKERSFVRYSQMMWFMVRGVWGLLGFTTTIMLYRYITEWIPQQRERVEAEQRNLAQASRLLATAEAATDPLEAALVALELQGLPEPANGLARIQKIGLRVVPRSVVSTPLGDDGQRFAFSPDGTLFAGPDGYGAIVWDTTQGATLYRRVGPNWQFSSVGFLGNDTVLGATSKSEIVRTTIDGRVRAPSQEEPRLQLSEITPIGAPEPMNIRVLKDRTIVAVKKSFGIWFLDENGRPIQSLAYSAPDRSLWDQWDITPDGRVFVTSTPGTITIHRRNFAQKTRVRLPEVRAVALSPDGSTLAVAYAERIRLIDTVQSARSNEVVRKQPVTALAFSGDGQQLAWGETNGVVTVWDRRSLAAVTLRGHSTSILEIIFSPDGKLMATRAKGEGMARLWPTENDRVVIPGNWQSVAHAFRLRTTTCLSPERRQKLIGEDEDVAFRNAQLCEAGQGRLSHFTSGGFGR